MTIDPFIGQLQTVDDVNKFSLTLDTIVRSSYEKGGNLKKSLEKFLDKETLSQLSAQEKTSSSKEPDLTKELVELAADLKKLPAINLTLAFRPSTNLVNKISLWLRKNVNPTILIDLAVEPQIIGGAIIVDHGKVIDLSVKKKLDQYFKDNQAEIQKHFVE